jgi:hypothetical protein
MPSKKREKENRKKNKNKNKKRNTTVICILRVKGKPHNAMHTSVCDVISFKRYEKVLLCTSFRFNLT